MKKYGSKILTSVSFVGIAISNIKADTGDISFKIGDKVYSCASKKVDHTINAVNILIGELGKINDDFSSDELEFNPSNDLKNYFIESITSESDESVKLDKTTVSLAVDKPVVIKLVPKRDYIKFEYKEKGKQLTKAYEDKFLEEVVQGKKICAINPLGVLFDFDGSKFNGEDIAGNDKIIGSDEVNVLDKTKKIEFKINSDKITADHFKTVVCKFAEGVEGKLVETVKLDNIYDSSLGDIKSKTKGTEVLAELNKIKVDDTNDSFFKGSFEILNGDDNTKKLTTEDIMDTNTLSDATFIVLNGIKEENINPIFLKKNFTVEFDNEGNNDKKIDQKEILWQIRDTLNNDLKDKVDIKVSDITKIISDFNSGKPNDTIIKNAFDTLDNISIVGVKNEVNGTLGFNDVVNSKDIIVNLKEGVFAEGIVKYIVKTKFNFDVNFDAVKKGDKVLNDTIVKIINDFKGNMKGFDEELQIEVFITNVNNAFKKYFLEGKSLDANDFNFSACKQNENDSNLNKSGTIIAKGSIVNKLKESCFEKSDKPKNPEGKTDNTGTGSGSGDGNGGNTSKKGCCGSGKE